MGPGRGQYNRHRYAWMCILGALVGASTVAHAQISCQFEGNYCGWTPSPAQIWQVTQGSVSTTAKPPAAGQWMAAANSPTGDEMYAELLSQEIYLTFQTTLTFRVLQQMFGSNNEPYIQLNVVPSDGSPELRIYSKNDQFSWTNPFVVNLEPRSTAFRLKFRLKVRSRTFWTALNNIVLRDEALIGPPTTTVTPIPTTTTIAASNLDRFITCTFRAGMCAWRNAADNHVSWTVESGTSIGLGLPGAPDASTDEQYLMTRAGNSLTQRYFSRLRSPAFEYTGTTQISFWYNFKSEGGSLVGRTLLFVAGSQSLEITGSTFNGEFDTWHQAQFTINSNGFNEFEFVASMEAQDQIAVDEIVWTGDENGAPNTLPTTTVTTTQSTTTPSTLPTTTSAPRNPLTCSFAENLCGWTTETIDTFQWQRVNTVTASPQNIVAQPDIDGWFLFAQGTELSNADRAHLVSNSITLRARAVLRFYVYATAAAGDGIYVNLNFADGEQLTISRQILGSTTFNRWAQHSVLIETLNREFSIVIGAGVMSIRRFGLDEITFAPEGEVVYGSSPIFLTTTPRTTTQRSTPTPQPAVTDAILTCSFATDLCGWRTHPESEGEWQRTQDAGVTNLPATASDQLADPWFVAFRGTSAADMSQGLLESRQFLNDRARYISLWYYKRGVSTGISYLGLRLADQNGVQGDNIWRHQGIADPDWEQIRIPINTTGLISLVFYCGANNFIICGLDEIQLENEADLEILPFPGSGSTPGGTLPTSQPLPSEPLPAVTCDFEDGYCKGWLNIGDILWEHTNDSAPLISAGAHQGSGFVYSTLSFGGREYAAKLRTEEINALTDELTYGKVTFWVNHANAVSHYRFSVHAISSVLEHDEIAFADPATDTNRWIQQEAYFCLNGPGHLVFRAEHSDVLTSIGLDDIVGELYREPVGNPVCPMPTDAPVTTEASTRFPLVTPEPHGDCYSWSPLPGASCSFDTGICDGWGSLGFYLPFVFGNGPVETGAGIPDDQPSSGYAMTNCTIRPAVPDQPQELISELDGPNVQVEDGKTFHGRVTFWYYFNNIRGDNKYLQVYLTTILNTVVIWNVDQGQSGRWRYAEAHFEADIGFHVTFVAEHSRCGTPVAIDSVSVEEGTETECESFLTCDFEHTLCGWTSDDMFLGWQIGTGTTGLDGYAIVAPDNETYVYVDSNLWALNRPAVLKSKSFVPYHGFMSVRFHAYGYGVASLSLFGETASGRFQLWETGPSHRGWQMASIEICFNETFVLSFEAVFSAPGFLIGLDDVVMRTDNQLMSNLSCAILPQHTTPAGVSTVTAGTRTTTPEPTTTMTTVLTLPPNHEGNISCEFDGNLCDWRNVPNALPWTTANNDPVAVDAAHNGAYAVARVGNATGLTLARMISPTFNAFDFKEELEIEFFYQTSGRGSTGIAVYLVQGSQIPDSPVFTSDSGVVGQWTRARTVFSIRECNGRLPCRLMLETRFLRPNTWSAVDSFQLHLENGVTLGTTPISLTTMDPTMEVIEEGTCSFDVGFCSGWMSPGFYKWHESVADPIGVSPQAGHGFVYVENEGILSAEGRFAELQSPAFTANDASHNHTRSATLSFWYYFGYGTATFQVYSKSADEWWNDQPEENSVWKVTHSVSANYQRRWRQVTVRLCFEDTRSLVFRVTPSNTFAHVGLDEVITTRNNVGPHTCESLQYADVTCGFESGTCGWHNEESIGLNWRRTRVAGSYFMATQSDNVWQVSGTARLISDTIHQQVPNPTRLSFYYGNPEGGHGTTKLKVKVFDQEHEIWHAPRSNTTTWQRMDVVICQDPGYQLVFESTVAGVQVDDIELTGEIEPAPPGFNPQCPSPILTCDFEDGMCGWTTEIGKNLRFRRAQTVENAVDSGVIGSAAQGTWFVYAAANQRQDSDEVARLVANGAVKLARDGKFSFWYHARGHGVNFVRLTKTKLGMNGIEFDVLWEETGGNTDQWKRAEVVLCDSAEFYLEFSAGFILPDYVVAFDALELEDEGAISGAIPPDTFLCPGQTVTTISCDFESDLCGWTNNGLGIDWHIQPPGDGGEHYMTAQSRDAPFDGAIARITSRPVTSAMPRNTHFMFGYRMPSNGIKYLRVILREPASDQVLWERNGAQGADWIWTKFTVCPRMSGFSFVFETAFEEGDHQVDIDEVRYVGEQNTEDAWPGTCPLVSCNFEHDMCGWENHQTAASSWSRSNALLEEFDHYEATPDGFWHVESQGARNGHLTFARLISPCIRIQGSTPMNFWHHEYGQGIEYLTLKAFHPNGQESILWQQEGAPGVWLRPEITVGVTGSVRLVLEAAFTASMGVVGIDKIKLLNEAERLTLADDCPAYPADRPLPPITPASHTMSCSFDRNFCAWSHAENFTIASAFTGFGGSVGGFALARRSATLVGPMVMLQQRTQMFFFYRAHDDLEEAELNVYYEDGRVENLWRLARSSVGFGRWIPVRVPLCLDGRFRLVFNIQLNGFGNYGFALDEIIITAETSSITTGLSAFNCTAQTLPSNTVSCDFGSSQCGWEVYDNNDVVVQRGRIPGDDEHATPVMYALPSPTEDLGYTYLRSPDKVVEAGTVFSFSYLQRGSALGYLEARFPNGTTLEMLDLSPAEDWTSVSVALPAVTIGENVQMRFLFGFDKTLTQRSKRALPEDVFALDDVWYSTEEGFVPDEQIDIITEDGCEPPSHTGVTCDFQCGATCGWQPPSRPAVGWRAVNGSYGVGPYAVYNDDSEGYLVADSQDVTVITDTLEMRSKAFPYVNSSMAFAYRAFGHGIKHLRLYGEQAGNQRFLLWETGDASREWLYTLVSVCFNDPVVLVFEAQFNARGFYVAIDHVIMNEDPDTNAPTSQCPAVELHTTSQPITTDSGQTTGPTTPAPIIIPEPIPGTISCDFGEGSHADMCGWQNADSLQPQWTPLLRIGQTNVSTVFEAEPGNFFAGATMGNETVRSTRLVSANLATANILNASSNHFHVEFFYRTSGRNVAGLAVFVATSNQLPATPIWAAGSGAIEWTRAVIDFDRPSSSRIQLVLEARYIQRGAWIAVDRVVLAGENGNVLPPTIATTVQQPLAIVEAATCSFDVGLCPGWIGVNFIENFNRSYHGVAAQAGNGYVSAEHPEGFSELFTRPLLLLDQEETTVEVTFWYLLGPGTQLELQIHEPALGNGLVGVVWEVTNNAGDVENPLTWHFVRQKICVPRNETTMVVFHVNHRIEGSFAAIDEVISTKSDESCEPLIPEPQSTNVTCDFEDFETCGWQSTDGWRPVRGPHGPPGYGITDVNEGYMLVSSSSLPSLNQPATLVTRSNIFPAVRSVLSFSYRAYGHGIHSLQLFAIRADERFLIWETDNFNQLWVNDVAPLCFNDPVKLAFEARFNSRGFYIGLDHVVLLGEGSDAIIPTEACPDVIPHSTVPYLTSPTPSGITTTEPPVTLPVAFDGEISCSFEANDLCAWRNLDSIPWTVSASHNNVSAHAGNYMAVAMPRGSTGHRASLVSPNINATLFHGHQLSFQFYYRVNDRGSTGVSLYTITSDVEPTTEYAHFGPAPFGQWNLALVNLRIDPDAPRRQLQLTSLFTQPNSFVAIDDIILHAETGDTVPTRPPTPTTPALITVIESGTCSFDVGLCEGWQAEHWKESVVVPGPTGAQSGRGYMYVDEVKDRSVRNDTISAELRTPPFHRDFSAQTSSKMTFWYRAGPGAATLEVMLRETAAGYLDAESSVFSVNPLVHEQWIPVTVTFCSTGQQVVVFRVFFGDDFTYLALDEVLTIKDTVDHCPDVCSKWEVAAECDFEEGLCDGWELGLTLTVNGQETSAEGFVVANFTSVPAPTHNDTGDSFLVNHCFFDTDPADMGGPGHVSAVRSPNVTFEAERSQGRISFWYYSHGQFPATNNLGIVVMDASVHNVEAAIEIPLFIQVIPGRWNYVHQTTIIPKGVHYAVVFTTQTRCEVFMIVDEIVIERNVPTECLDVSCTFDDGHTCEWENTTDPGFWRLGSGHVGSPAYGINGSAHGSGFLYLDSNDLPSVNYPAGIRTSITLPSQTADFFFYYRAFGTGIASVYLYAVHEDGVRYPLWHTSNAARQWIPAYVRLCLNEPFKLEFEGIFVARDFVIGLDAFHLAEIGPAVDCLELTTPRPPVSITTAGPVTLPTVPTTLPVVLPPAWNGPISCDFENNTLCSWRNLDDSANTSKWRVVESVGSGIAQIPAAYRGRYFAAAQPTSTSRVARLMSANLDSDCSQPFNIEFYYRTSGRFVQGISAYLAVSDAFPASSVWHTGHGDIGQWQRAVISIRQADGADASRCQLILETHFTRLDSWTGIDEISLESETGSTFRPTQTFPTTRPPTSTVTPTVSTRPPVTPPPLQEYSCSFDDGLCEGWSSLGLLHWQTANHSHAGVQPFRGEGFAFVEETIHNQHDRYAELETPVFWAIRNGSHAFVMDFWYLFGQGTATLEVITKPQGEHFEDPAKEGTLWTVTHTTDNDPVYRYWRRASVQGCFDTAQLMTVVFRLTPSERHFTIAALDEVVTTARPDLLGPEQQCPPHKFDHTVTCDFQTDEPTNYICGWDIQSGSGITWNWINNASNFFLATIPTNASAAAPATRLVSMHVNQFPPNPTKLTFRYRFPRDVHGGYLKLNVKIFEEEYEIWRATPTLQWQTATVYLCFEPGYQLVLETTALDVSVDDFVLVGETAPVQPGEIDGYCRSPLMTCGFEDGFCGWRETSFHRYREDAGQNAALGTWYVKAESADSEPATPVLRIYDTIKLRAATQFTFYYFLHGPVRQLSLIKGHKGYDGTYEQVLWTAEETGLTGWRMAEVTVCDENPFTLFFLANFAAADSVVGLDGFVLDNEASLSGQLPPDTYTCPGAPQTTITCDFEAGNCGWMNALYYRNYFEILNTSIGTPPAVILGAKYGSNYLASQSSNSINGSNNVARIMSRPITSAMPHNTQVTFWYNIAAYQLRYFRLIVRQNEVDEIVWERSGGNAPGWKEAVLTVCGKAGAQLILEVAFTLPDSVVAVDDVRYRGENNLAASVPGLCPVVSCHFEDGFCGWLSDIRAAPYNNRWVRSTSRIDYHDHPNNGKSGRFHVQSTGIPNQDLSIARLYTPCLAISADTSLEFFVHLYGPSIQYVQLKSLSNATNNETVLWSSSSAQSNTWLHPTLPIPASSNVVFILEAAFSDADSTVAIDQIRLLNEAEVVTLGDNCPGVAPVTPATTRPTRPTVTTPVPPLPTGTLSCSFNSHFCGYGYQGFRISNTSEDITTSVGGGMALFQPNTQQRHASLLSRGFYVRERMQVFFFYFAHADVEVFTVKAHYVVNGQITSTDVLFELHGSAALGGMAFGRWIPGRVTLCVPGFSPLVQLEFSVTAGAGSSSEFALDEIIINRETQATSLTPLNSTLDCGPINRPNSLTCEDIAPGAPFCGWQAPSGVTTQVLPGTHETALVVLGEALSAGPVQIVSGEIPPHPEATSFAFKYMLVTRARLQVDLLVGGDNSLPYPLAPTENAERWNSAVVEVPASDQPSRITFRVSVLEVQNRQEPGLVPALFALTDTWYSAEEGFVAQLDNGTTTVPPVTTDSTVTSGPTVTTGSTITSGPTATSGSTVTSVTSQAPTSTTVPTTNATTPPIVVRPTTAPEAYSTQDIVLISVGSVAGALVLLGVVIALLHLRSKRRERKGRSYEEHVVTETPLTEMSTRTSTMSKPPAYSSKPPTPPPASGQSTPPPSQPTVAAFRTKGFDEETL